MDKCLSIYLQKTSSGVLVTVYQDTERLFFFGTDKFNYEKCLSYENVEELLDEAIDFAKWDEDGNDLEEGIEFFIEAKENYKDNFQKGMENVIFENFDLADAAKILKATPALRDSKIIIKGDYNFDISDFNEIEEMFNGCISDLNNLVFDFKLNNYVIGHGSKISLGEYKDTVEFINDVADEVKSLNLSPFEQVLYVYDYVKDRYYKEEKEDESQSLSRSLSDVVKGNNIVYYGFSNLMNAILTNLGFNSTCVQVNAGKGFNNIIAPPKSLTRDFGDYNMLNDKVLSFITDNLDNIRFLRICNHMRLDVYINDPKYGIDGIYYFDPTLDSKKANDSHQSTKYSHFAQTRKIMEDRDYGSVKYNFCPEGNKELFDKIEKCIETKDFTKLKMYEVLSFNYLADRVLGILNINVGKLLNQTLVNPIFKTEGEITLKILKEYFGTVRQYYEKPILGKAMLSSLYNVRKQQNILHPRKYPFSRENIIESCASYTNLDYNTPQGRLLTDICIKESVDKFLSTVDFENDQKEANMARTLKKKEDKK